MKNVVLVLPDKSYNLAVECSKKLGYKTVDEYIKNCSLWQLESFKEIEEYEKQEKKG